MYVLFILFYVPVYLIEMNEKSEQCSFVTPLLCLLLPYCYTYCYTYCYAYCFYLPVQTIGTIKHPRQSQQSWLLHLTIPTGRPHCGISVMTGKSFTPLCVVLFCSQSTVTVLSFLCQDFLLYKCYIMQFFFHT